MDAIEQVVSNCVLGLNVTQTMQQRYDDVGWKMSSPEFRKFRHIVIHLSKHIGKLSELAERWEHVAYDGGLGEDSVSVKTEADEIAAVVGALVHHSAQLSSLAGLSLAECFLQRLTANAKRFAPNTVFAELKMPSRAETLD